MCDRSDLLLCGCGGPLQRLLTLSGLDEARVLLLKATGLMTSASPESASAGPGLLVRWLLLKQLLLLAPGKQLYLLTRAPEPDQLGSSTRLPLR